MHAHTATALCFHSGFTGYDCSERECFAGESRSTVLAQAVAATRTVETAQLVCTCDATCSGTFVLRYKGSRVQIRPDMTEAQVLLLFLLVAALCSVLIEACTVLLAVFIVHSSER
jgi:hypothetical protein